MMPIRFFARAACALTLMTLPMLAPSYAQHTAFRATPQATSTTGKTVKVNVSGTDREKVGTITVLLDPKTAASLRKTATGIVFVGPARNPEKLAVTSPHPVPGGGQVVSDYATLPVNTKWGKDRVTYTFRATPQMLPNLRFELRDNAQSDPDKVSLWLMVRDFAADGK